MFLIPFQVLCIRNYFTHNFFIVSSLAVSSNIKMIATQLSSDRSTCQTTILQNRLIITSKIRFIFLFLAVIAAIDQGMITIWTGINCEFLLKLFKYDWIE